MVNIGVQSLARMLTNLLPDLLMVAITVFQVRGVHRIGLEVYNLTIGKFSKLESNPKLSNLNLIRSEFVKAFRSEKTFNKLNFPINCITVHQCQIFNF